MLLMWLSPLTLTQFNADHGETDFVFRLGKIFYHGSIYNATGHQVAPHLAAMVSAKYPRGLEDVGIRNSAEFM